MNDTTPNNQTENVTENTTQQANQNTEQSAPKTENNAHPQGEQRCGGRYAYGPQRFGSYADWQHWKQRRWKKVAVGALLVFLGFFIGKVTSHHGHHEFGRHGYGYQQPMMVVPYQAQPAPMPYQQSVPQAPMAVPMQPNVQR